MKFTHSNILEKMIKTLIGMGMIAAAVAIPGNEKVETVSEPVKIPVIEYKSWKCPDCNENEKYVLEQLQLHTRISDRNALATIMGNIKSESNFHPDICEGGARIPYQECTRGGYGLIQWTSAGRYANLGKFCTRHECDPSSLEGQTRYMINESVFQRYLPDFEGNGGTVPQYMIPAYYWLGWGIKGYREQYAYDYSNKLVLS